MLLIDSGNCWNIFAQILQPLIQKKKKEHEELISEVLGHVQSSTIGSLYMENGRPNIPIIRRL